KISALLNVIPFYKHEDSTFKSLNKDLLRIAQRIKDSAALAEANYNFGRYYIATLDVDSSYYHHYEAEKLYKAIKDDWNTAQVLLSIVIIQKDEKNFTRSEILSFEVHSYLDKLPSTILYTR